MIEGQDLTTILWMLRLSNQVKTFTYVILPLKFSLLSFFQERLLCCLNFCLHSLVSAEQQREERQAVEKKETPFCRIIIIINLVKLLSTFAFPFLFQRFAVSDSFSLLVLLYEPDLHLE